MTASHTTNVDSTKSDSPSGRLVSSQGGSPSDALLTRLQGDTGSSEHICDERTFAVGINVDVILLRSELHLQVSVPHRQARVSSQSIAERQPL